MMKRGKARHKAPGFKFLLANATDTRYNKNYVEARRGV